MPISSQREFVSSNWQWPKHVGRISSRPDISWNLRTDEAPLREPRAKRHSTKNTTLAPEEVLFRRKEAPDRWPHHDIYMAHERDLPGGGQGILPSSDLLKSVHSYASRFYDALGDHGKREAHYVGRRNINEASMDETALLALGILLEEAGKEALGKRGDLVFTEGEDIGGNGDGKVEAETGEQAADPPRIGDDSSLPSSLTVSNLQIRSAERRKRRRFS